jgi:hypothetical protein
VDQFSGSWGSVEGVGTRFLVSEASQSMSSVPGTTLTWWEVMLMYAFALRLELRAFVH